MKRALILQHAKCEGPALIADWLERHGWTLEVFDFPSRKTPPVLADFQLLVIMGGAMNIYQHRDHPWLVAEKELIRQAIHAELPVIGVCLGAQLLSDALGGKVFQNPHHEIGWWPVDFTPEARAIFPGLPASAVFLHWHGDTFTLPAGAIRVAESTACAEQGFLWKDRLLALQFHPEADERLAGEFCEDPGDHWPRGSWVQPPAQIASTAGPHSEIARKYLDVLLAGFFSRFEVTDAAPASPMDI